jgi:hypothetical protein
MNTKILAVAVGALILVGLGGFLLMGQNKVATTTTQTPTPTSVPNDQKSLSDILESGQDQRCTFKTADGKTEGTFYASKGNVRVDIKTMTDGKENKISVLRVGEDNYIWGTNMATGVKMKLSAEDFKSNAQIQQYVNPGEKSNYTCGAWNVDQSLLKVPTDIKFTDLGSVVMPKTTGTTTSPCDQLSNPTDKLACQKAMQNKGY